MSDPKNAVKTIADQSVNVIKKQEPVVYVVCSASDSDGSLFYQDDSPLPISCKRFDQIMFLIKLHYYWTISFKIYPRIFHS